MNSAAKHLRGFLEWLDVHREQGLVDVETTAKEIAEKMDVICEFRPVRTRKKRRIFSYECEDSNNQNPRYLFKTDYFLQIIDSIKQSMTERFEQLQAFVDKFEVIRDIASLRVETRDQINNKCGRLEVSLYSDRENFDINGDDLSEELSCLIYPARKNVSQICTEISCRPFFNRRISQHCCRVTHFPYCTNYSGCCYAISRA